VASPAKATASATITPAAAVSLLRSIDSDDCSDEFGVVIERLSDSSGLSFEVEIESAQDQTSVSLTILVDSKEVSSVQRYEDASFRSSELENVGIRPALSTATDVFDGDDIMAQAPKGLHRRKREVLVGKEAGHRSIRFVSSNLRVDKFDMTLYECPGARKIIATQAGIGPENFVVICTESSSSFEDPDRNSSSNDSRCTPADVGGLLNSGKVLWHIEQNLANQLSLLRWRQLR
jgi:hypothetical protein